MIEINHLLPQTSEQDHMHAEAMAKANDGDFIAARRMLYCLAQLYDSNTPEDAVNAARVRRDLAFVDVREALFLNDANTASDALRDAQESLQIATELTEDLMSREDLSPAADVYVRTEHGATIGLVARTLSARGVLRVVYEPGRHVGDIDDAARGSYYSAHQLFHQGSNMYYATSNAMNAARHARAMERLSNVPLWVARAGHAAIRSCFIDPDNSQSAVAAVTHGFDSLKSIEHARQSILREP